MIRLNSNFSKLVYITLQMTRLNSNYRTLLRNYGRERKL
nr:MAG TPA: hypothetical protein [Caudoviricetes sp.]